YLISLPPPPPPRSTPSPYTTLFRSQREIQNSLSLDGINSTSNLLAATSMRPIADAVTEIQVQTGSTSAEYGSYLGVHVNVVTKRSEEHTSELQSRVDLVCRLLLEKK